MHRKKIQTASEEKSSVLSRSTSLLDMHLEEIVEESEEIRALVSALKVMAPHDKKRDDYEARLWVALTHLDHHVKPAIKEWDRVLDKMPDG